MRKFMDRNGRRERPDEAALPVLQQAAEASGEAHQRPVTAVSEYSESADADADLEIARVG
jgi:hypothetical protein